jgi:hypothetical protein
MNRPRTRGDCVNGPRPCPWVGCRYHLCEVGGGDGRAARVALEGLSETCALDVADRGGCTLDEIGALWRITRERVRQIEGKALARLRESFDRILGGTTSRAVAGRLLRALMGLSAQDHDTSGFGVGPCGYMRGRARRIERRREAAERGAVDSG